MTTIDLDLLASVTGGDGFIDSAGRVLSAVGHDANIGAGIGGVVGTIGGGIAGGVATGGAGIIPGAWTGGRAGVAAGYIVGGGYGLVRGLVGESRRQ